MKKFAKWFGMVLVVLCTLPALMSCSAVQLGDKAVQPGVSHTTDISDKDSEDWQGRILEMLPQAKEGFGWVVFKGVALQRPLEWEEYTEGNTYCSSVESIPEKGSFETGLTIQVIRGVSELYKVSPKTLMARFVVDLEEQKENSRLIISPDSHDGVDTLIYRFRNAPKGLAPITVHKYFQCSEQGDFLNIITFETTDERWEEYWNEKGNTILSRVLVVP